MRFRKSVRICKGVRLNFSGSGVSMSLGVKGASITYGNKGSYVNYGIPGTGLYNRKKIASGRTSSRVSSLPSKTDKTYALSSRSNINDYSYDIFIDDRGQISLEVHDCLGHEVTNNAIISRIRRSDEYRHRLENALAQKKSDVNEQTLSLINICRLTEKAVDFDSLKKKYEQLKRFPDPSTYFDIPYPSREDLRLKLEKEAKEHISSILFWTNSMRRKEYVDRRIEEEYSNQINEWEAKKEKFIKDEISRHDIERQHLENILRTDPDGIYSNIEEVLNNISLPVEFSVNYEIANRSLYVDLDLPEIEDMPLEKAHTLSNGKISIKQKTQKEQAADYALCVCGMSYFFTGLFFNTTPEIDDIFISAYTQRENAKSGVVEDQYVYSVMFDRERFSQLNFDTIDPIQTLYTFPHNITITKSFKLETIDLEKPLTTEVIKQESSVAKPIKDVSSSIEESVSLYDQMTGRKKNVVVPSGSILVEIKEDDKTIFCLDDKTFIHLDEYYDDNDRKYIVVNKSKWQNAIKEMKRRQARDKEIELTASLNNQGMSLEKEGREDDAISIYEQNVERKCNATYSYDRLLVLYRKRKDKVNELRVAKIASSIFPNELKYKKRLERLLGGDIQEPNYPTEAKEFLSDIKHGDEFEQLILQLPEFDFYHNGTDGNYNKLNSDVLSPVWELRWYFKSLLESAEIAESRKDYVNASMIYEQIIGENYWMPSACDRLVKIYSKAKLKDAEIRVLKKGISYFSALREKRLDYVKSLAVKYGATDFLNERVQSGGKITYYDGVFELYNPFPIVEKWEERLNKKTAQ